MAIKIDDSAVTAKKPYQFHVDGGFFIGLNPN